MAVNDQGSINNASGYDSVNYYTTLPNGSAYRLDADIYHAEDLDGVMEGLLGSGNLNHLVMQSNELGGLADPTSSASNVLSDDALSATTATAASAGSVPITDDDIEAASRSGGSAGDTTNSLATDSVDLRSAGQPVEAANLAGGSSQFIAGGDQPSPIRAAAVGGDEAASEEAADPDIIEDTTPPEEPQPPESDLSSGSDGGGGGNPDQNGDGGSDGSAATVQAGVTVGLGSGGGTLADLDIDLQLGGAGSGLGNLVDAGIGLEGLVPGTVEEALTEVIDIADELLLEEGLVDDALDVVDEAFDTVADLTNVLGTDDGGLADLDIVSALDVTDSLNFGGAADDDAGDRDLTVDVNQSLIDLPLVDTPLEVDLDAVENIVGDVDIGIDLELDTPQLPIGDGSAEGSVSRHVEDLQDTVDDLTNSVGDSAVDAAEEAVSDFADTVSDVTGAATEGAETAADLTGSVSETIMAPIADQGDAAADAVDAILNQIVSDAASPDVPAAPAEPATPDVPVAPAVPEAPAVADVASAVEETVDGAEASAADVVDEISGALDSAVDGLGAAALPEAGESDAEDSDVIADVDLGVGDVSLAAVDAEVGLDPVEAILGDIDAEINVTAIDAASPDVPVAPAVPEAPAVADFASAVEETVDGAESEAIEAIVSEIEVDLDALGGIIDVAESDFIADFSAEGDEALGTLEEGSNALADLAASASDAELDGLPEPTGLLGEGIGLLADIQTDQSLGGGLFG